MIEGRKIPAATISRLPIYLRELGDINREGEHVVSSRLLAERTGLTSEQIRKDLAYFGAFGTRGIGYDVRHLDLAIRRILGLTAEVPVAVVGAGHLGTALIRHLQRRESGLFVAAVFDSDPQKQGQRTGGQVVLAAEMISEVVRKAGITLAAIAVPSPSAHETLRRLAEGGVGAILNFSPVKLEHPRVVVKNLDLSTELQALAYYGPGAGGERAG